MTYFDNYIISIERIQYGVRHNKEYFIKNLVEIYCALPLWEMIEPDTINVLVVSGFGGLRINE